MASRDAITTRVEGLEASRAALEAILRAERGVIQKQLGVIGQQAVTEIQRRAPLLTGRLRRSYTYVVGAGWVEIGTNVDYAPHQEFGTQYQSGKPHVRPGIEAVIKKVPMLLAAGMGAAGRAAGARFSSGASGSLKRTISNL